MSGSSTRCASCGFYLPAAPPLRTGPPTARPAAPKANPQRKMLAVLIVGGCLVVGLFIAGAAIALREPPPSTTQTPVAPSAAMPPSEPRRIDPTQLLAEAKKQAGAWHPDAVLVSFELSRLDARGVAPDGEAELVYSRPAGSRFTGGAETGSEQLVLRSRDGSLQKDGERAGKAHVAPEPNCTFEDAWAAAQRAGAANDGRNRLRYLWSERHARPVWELLGGDGEVQRRLDGVTCSILTR